MRTDPSAPSAPESIQLGQTIFALGFPMPDLQGFSPKITKGVLSSMSGMQDDVRRFQIDAAVQPGNSGGPLADEDGNIVGVVVARLNDAALLRETGSVAQNVNYAIKQSYAVAFLENYQALKGKIAIKGRSGAIPFEKAVSNVEKATVLVVVY